MAEREGFEPTITDKVCPLSRRIVLTTQAPLREISCQWRRLTALSKKFLQHLRRTSRQYSALNLHLMIQAGMIQYLQNRMDGAGLRIVGTIHQAANAGMHRSSRAHGARLNCSKQ